MAITILDLPFEVLILISQQIEAFHDKVNFARSHPKLWNVFAYHHRKNVQNEITFTNNEEFKYMITHFDFILEWWGSSVISIKNPYNDVESGDLLEMAAKFCPNLKHIQFVIHGDNLRKVEQCVSKCEMLNEIELRIEYPFNWNYTPENDYHLDKVIKSLQSLTNLRYINFGSHALKKDERTKLNDLVQLDELQIGPIQADEVDDLTSLLGHLIVLRIKYYPDTKTLSKLAKYCGNLQKLSLEDYDNRSYMLEFSRKWRIPYFPKLTYLHIFKGTARSDFLYHLDSRYNNQLKVLNIPCLRMRKREIKRVSEFKVLKELFCTEIQKKSIDVLVKMQLERIDYWNSMKSEFHVLRLVKESTYLTSMRCSIRNWNKKFFCDFLDILERKGFQADRPFQLDILFIQNDDLKKEFIVEFTSIPNSNLMSLRLI
ncbi:uncharacterized protein LOC133845796 [Drosophila sulfurigaster albostrigata]|uniref:uncharacterized protein LOC133845796 n=1 Tax=Drosophila sulfurigaster albostrigata TaxID=89887 RepID=UPI002D21BBF6|nr:uncharacterized protein LOC133845796 [Drosophila sulfurigaster albostrigata]